MNNHLQAGLRAARGGLLLGLLHLASVPVGLWLFGNEPRWTVSLMTAGVWVLAFAVGGVLYSMVLPAFAGRRVPASAGARLGAGMAAGAATLLLLLAAFFLSAGAFRDGAEAWLLLATGLGALVGGWAGLLATERRS